MASWAQDTIRYPINPMKGVRIGIDVAKLALPLMYSGDRYGFEATVDVHIKKNFFATVEGGWLEANINKEEYRYHSSGYYGKLGADYNVLKSRVPNSNDIFYVGARYAFSMFSFECDDVTIPGYYWPDATGQSIPKTDLSAQWLELLMGVKAEVLKNFYIGLTLRGKFLLATPKDDYSAAYQIPGYGDGTKRFVGGLNYYISYNIKF